MRNLTFSYMFLAGLLSNLGCGDDDKPCFSPTQNLDTAYSNGAKGCGCTVGKDQDVCVADSTGRRVALVCERSQGTPSRTGRACLCLSDQFIGMLYAIAGAGFAGSRHSARFSEMIAFW